MFTRKFLICYSLLQKLKFSASSECITLTQCWRFLNFSYLVGVYFEVNARLFPMIQRPLQIDPSSGCLCIDPVMVAHML